MVSHRYMCIEDHIIICMLTCLRRIHEEYHSSINNTNPLAAKLFNWNFRSLEVMSR